jgi:glycosyltransferase involved in cell wall biosynthesis
MGSEADSSPSEAFFSGQPSLRLLHTLNHLSDRGNGIINLAVDLAIEQRALGHSVAFACGGGGHEATLKRYGIQHYDLHQSKSLAAAAPSAFALRRIIRDFKPDLVHAHMRMGLLLAWPWCKLSRIPLVSHLHNVHDKESLLMGVADRVIAVSEAVSRDMQRQGIAAKKLRVVLNGTLDSPRLPPFSTIEARTLQHPAISTVAGLNERKGIEELIQAFALVADEFPAAHLYLVGDGPNRAQFEQQAAALACSPRIHFEGFQSVPQGYMRASDVFVLASRRESFGLVLSEARQAGCAIVATDVDGIPEALATGDPEKPAGILIPPRNPSALAAALRCLMTDEAMAATYRERSKIGLERFTTKVMAAEVGKVYDELLHAD